MTLLLAGCGHVPPGNADVRAAMAKQIEQISGQTGFDSQKEELATVKAGKCVKADLGGFDCEFTTGGGTQTVPFKKGWELSGG